MQKNTNITPQALFEAYAVVERGRFTEISPGAAEYLPENAAELEAAAVLPVLNSVGENGAVTVPYRFGAQEADLSVLAADGKRLVVFSPSSGVRAHIPGERFGYAISRSLSSGVAAANLLFVDNDTVAQTPENKAYVEMLIKSQYRLLRSAGQLSDFLAFNNGSLGLQISEVDVARQLTELTEAIKPLLTERKLNISCECSPASLIACVDRFRIEQLVLNLVSNSVKYTPEGGTVSLRFAADEKFMRISVADNGPGIAPEVMDSLFTRYCAEPDHKDPNAGTGLGLALVMTTARLHGGTVIVDNRPGKGVSVTASLPIRRGLPTVSANLLRPSLQQGYGSVFTELADVLASNVYLPAFLD